MGKSASSRAWLQRQEQDPYVLKARQMGYRSRALFKLEEIDVKFNIFTGSANVLDLGASPGGWSQYVAKKLTTPNKKIFAIDLIEMKNIEGVNFIRGNINEINIEEFTENLPINILMSDMAPNSCGHRQTDHLQMMSLCETVLDVTNKHLAKNGTLILKMWQGEGDRELLKTATNTFEKVARFKPKSSRAESKELYLIATGFGHPKSSTKTRLDI